MRKAGAKVQRSEQNTKGKLIFLRVLSKSENKLGLNFALCALIRTFAV